MMVADIVGSSRILARKVHIRRHLVEGSCTSDVGPWRGQVSGTRDGATFLLETTLLCSSDPPKITKIIRKWKKSVPVARSPTDWEDALNSAGEHVTFFSPMTERGFPHILPDREVGFPNPIGKLTQLRDAGAFETRNFPETSHKWRKA